MQRECSILDNVELMLFICELYTQFTYHIYIHIFFGSIICCCNFSTIKSQYSAFHSYFDSLAYRLVNDYSWFFSSLLNQWKAISSESRQKKTRCELCLKQCIDFIDEASRKKTPLVVNNFRKKEISTFKIRNIDWNAMPYVRCNCFPF